MRTLGIILSLTGFMGLGAQTLSLRQLEDRIPLTFELSKEKLELSAFPLLESIETMGMDLKVGYEVMNTNRPGMSEHKISLKQDISPVFQDNAARQRIQNRAVQRALMVEDWEKKFRMNFQKLLIELNALRLRLSLGLQGLDVLTQIQDQAEIRFSTGKMNLPQWNRVQIQKSLLSLEIRELNNMIRVVHLKILTQVNWPSQDFPLEEFSVQLSPESLAPALDQDLWALAQKNWAPWKILQEEVQGLQWEAQKIGWGFLPSLMLEASYTAMPTAWDRGGLSLGVQLSVPTFSLEARQKEFQMNDVEKSINLENLAQVQDALPRELQRAADSVKWALGSLKELETTTLPLLQQSLNLVMEEYIVDRADFSDILMLTMETLETQEKIIDLKTSLYYDMADLEYWTGIKALQFLPSPQRSTP